MMREDPARLWEVGYAPLEAGRAREDEQLADLPDTGSPVVRCRPRSPGIAAKGMRGTPGIAAKVFAAVARARVNVEAIAQGSSECNISFAVDERQRVDAVKALHRVVSRG